ncbi:MAG: cytochrome C [Phyllobacteriaceae bacterium]|nr:cytochrome C [Phyllobacteriaceae bacterium]MBA91910.1 cytochrome C [Phyllobacteriaceae bacterium]
MRASTIGPAVAALLAGQLFAGPAGAAGLLKPDDREIVAQGGAIYADHCAVCHGADLGGEPDWRTRKDNGRMPAPPHDETGHTWHHPDQILFDITKLGIVQAAGLKNYTSDMPIYGDILSDGEIIAVLSWIKAQWPDEVRALHDQMNARYAQERE